MYLAVVVARLIVCGMKVPAAIKRIALADHWINFFSAWEDYESRDIVAALKKRFKKHLEESRTAATAITGLRDSPPKERHQMLKNYIKNNYLKNKEKLVTSFSLFFNLSLIRR